MVIAAVVGDVERSSGMASSVANHPSVVLCAVDENPSTVVVAVESVPVRYCYGGRRQCGGDNVVSNNRVETVGIDIDMVY